MNLKKSDFLQGVKVCPLTCRCVLAVLRVIRRGTSPPNDGQHRARMRSDRAMELDEKKDAYAMPMHNA